MSHLISAQSLYQQLHDLEQAVDLLVIDTRFSLQDPQAGQQAYRQGHLPGAFYLDLDQDLSGPHARHGGRHPLPPVETLVDKLRACGLHNNSRVVVYDDQGSMFAVRLWWQLRYLGHFQTQVLNGGLSAWQAAGYPLTQELPQAQPGDFEPHLQAHLLLQMADVRARLNQPGVVLLDARSPERYSGAQEPLDPKAGHIPGALNRPFQANLEAGKFKTPTQLKAELAPLVADAQEVIVYCGSGVTANHTLLALEEAGLPGAKLYAGSWSDWVSYPENPVATGSD